MRHSRALVVCLASMMFFSLNAASGPASAFSLSVDDFWKYESTWDMGTYDLTGTTSYTIEDKDTITVGGEQHRVYVYSVTGSMSGFTELMGVDIAVTTFTAGVIYDLVGAFATVKSDVTYWMNLTGSMGSIQIAVSTQTQNIVTYSPPLMGGFDPDTAGPSDSWDETITETSTEIVLENGVETSRETEVEVRTYSYAIDSSAITLTTAAGEFETLRITMIDDEGYREVMYWSSKVGGYVRYESYDPGESQPAMVEALLDYEHRTALGSLTFVLIGLVAAAVAVLILLLVVVKMRRPRAPQQHIPPPQAPPQPPFSPGPPPSQ